MADSKEIVPFLDLKAGYLELEDEIKDATDRFFQSGQYILGKEVEAFEEEFADFCDSKNCVGVASGLDALIILLKAYGIGNGDKVIVPSNTYIATALAVNAVGATPLFCEPCPSSYNICPEKFEIMLKIERPQAAIVVHLYGQMAAIEKIKKITDRYNVILIEDAAQAHGAKRNDLSPGKLSDGAAFSFYPGKNLGAFGDAGAIIVEDEKIAAKCKLYRNYGSGIKYHNEIKGMNSRLDELHASILRIKLRHLDEWNDRRCIIAQYYIDNLQDLTPTLRLPKILEGNIHAWHLFIIAVPNRELIASALNNEKIQTMVHYPIPPFEQPAYSEVYGKYPVAEKLAKEVLSLPIGPHLTLDKAQRVVVALKKVLSILN